MQRNYLAILFFCIFFSSSASLAQGSIDRAFIKLHKKAIKDDITNGQFKKERKKDQLEYMINLKKGLLHGQAKRFYKDGHIQEETTYLNGTPNGQYIKYRKNGNKESVANFSNGKLNGLAQSFYKDGTLKSSENYSSGVLNGLFKTYVNEILQKDGNYKNGILEGSLKSYYYNGQLWTTENYSEGVLHGWRKEYNTDGTLIENREYKYGKPIYTPQELAEQLIWVQTFSAISQSINAYNNSRPRTYTGTINNTGYGGYNVRMVGY